MNGRKLFREYAQSQGKEAKEFIKIEKDSFNYGSEYLITKDNNGNSERTLVNYQDMIHWIIKTKKVVSR